MTHDILLLDSHRSVMDWDISCARHSSLQFPETDWSNYPNTLLWHQNQYISLDQIYQTLNRQNEFKPQRFNLPDGRYWEIAQPDFFLKCQLDKMSSVRITNKINNKKTREFYLNHDLLQGKQSPFAIFSLDRFLPNSLYYFDNYLFSIGYNINNRNKGELRIVNKGIAVTIPLPSHLTYLNIVDIKSSRHGYVLNCWEKEKFNINQLPFPNIKHHYQHISLHAKYNNSKIFLIPYDFRSIYQISNHHLSNDEIVTTYIPKGWFNYRNLSQSDISELKALKVKYFYKNMICFAATYHFNNVFTMINPDWTIRNTIEHLKLLREKIKKIHPNDISQEICVIRDILWT